MLDLTLERVATPKEKETAAATYELFTAAGFTGTYAGGSRSKGNGFWLNSPTGKPLGYKNCRQIQKMIKNLVSFVNLIEEL